MPLNSQRLPEFVINELRDTPYDKVSAADTAYQTKVEIYDKKCSDSGCKFCRVIALRGTKVREFNNTQEAIIYARKHLHTVEIERSCSYPADIKIVNGETQYPSLTEIVMNGCDFWRLDKLNIPKDEDTAFIIITEINGQDINRDIRESISAQSISQ